MHFARGLAYLEAEKLPDAEASFARAVEIERDYSGTAQFGVGLRASGRSEEAEAAYLRVGVSSAHVVHRGCETYDV